MTAHGEAQAAYFALLRAREEVEALRRYGEHLEAERQRLDAFAGHVNTDPPGVPGALRRRLDATAKPLLEAIGRRRATVLAELDRLPERIGAAEAYVVECEAEVSTLRGG